MFQMKLSFFTQDENFPFFIQYGIHDENMYLHSHENFCELVIVLSGSATHIVNNEAFYISKGDVFVIGSDTYHGYCDINDFRICNIMFKLDFFFSGNCDIQKVPGFQGLFIIEPILSQKKGFQNRLKLDCYNFEIIHHLITSMITEYESQTLGFKTYVSSSFYLLAVLLSRLYEKPYDSKSPYSANLDDSHNIIGMSKAIAYIEDHYMEDLTLETLAKIAGFSPRHFSRRFYEIRQTTPIHYMQALRLEKSTYYLKNTSLSISTIATKCGFSDSNYFSRLFKKRYGVSPTHFY